MYIDDHNGYVLAPSAHIEVQTQRVPVPGYLDLKYIHTGSYTYVGPAGVVMSHVDHHVHIRNNLMSLGFLSITSAVADHVHHDYPDVDNHL